jgi:hypothetical protein
MSNFSKDIQGKIFYGYVLDIPDPMEAGRTAVYIPDLMPTSIPGSKYTFCVNLINTYFKSRNTFSVSKEMISYGSYMPLLTGTKVIVMFLKNNLNSGYIIGIDADIKKPKTRSKNFYQLIKTQKNKEIIIDDDLGFFFLKVQDGKDIQAGSIFINDDTINLQLSGQSPDGPFFERQSSLELGKNYFRLNIGEAIYQFDENGFSMSLGEDKATYFDISVDGISMQGNKYVNISSENGKAHIYSPETYVTGDVELHLYGNDTRLTGAQKAQITGLTINLQSFLDIHLKSMNINMQSLVKYSIKTTMYDKIVTTIANEYSSVHNTSSILHTTSSTTYSRASTNDLIDSFALNGMGMGSSTSTSIATNTVGTMTAIDTTFMTIGTTLLINDPFTGFTAQNLVSQMAGSANQAAGATINLNIVPDEKNNNVTGLLNKLNDDSKDKYVQFDKIKV